MCKSKGVGCSEISSNSPWLKYWQLGSRGEACGWQRALGLEWEGVDRPAREHGEKEGRGGWEIGKGQGHTEALESWLRWSPGGKSQWASKERQRALYQETYKLTAMRN